MRKWWSCHLFLSHQLLDFFWLQLPKNPQSAVSSWEFEWLSTTWMWVYTVCDVHEKRAVAEGPRARLKPWLELHTSTAGMLCSFWFLESVWPDLRSFQRSQPLGTKNKTYSPTSMEYHTHHRWFSHGNSEKIDCWQLLTAQCTKFVHGDWSITLESDSKINTVYR